MTAGPTARPPLAAPVHVRADGQYEVAFPAVDQPRRVAGVRVRASGVEVELQLVRWHLGRAGDVERSADPRRLRRPLVVPAGASVAVVLVATRTEPEGVCLVDLDLSPRSSL